MAHDALALDFPRQSVAQLPDGFETVDMKFAIQ